MRWRKLGQLYDTAGVQKHPKIFSHAANPLPIHIKGNVYRIFYSGRDACNKSSVGAVDIDLLKREVIRDYHDPFFVHGSIGSFFHDGVSIGNDYEVDGVRYILFMGWQNPDDQHWRGDIGRLILTPNFDLVIDTDTVFMGIDATDQISLSYPWVLKSQTGLYKMWYGSTKSWDAGNGEMLHVINYAYSKDGHQWTREGLAVPFEMGEAQAFSRPTLIENSDGGLQMWYSFRSGCGRAYRIGYAEAVDGKKWVRKDDEAGIDVSQTGWDSQMIEYPFVFDHLGERYMLYNGNGFGKTGFGLAVMEK